MHIEELGPKGKKELQDILKSLEYMRKYFFFKLSESTESVNEITLARGLKDLIKGTTSSVEGIKVSKELASAIAGWATGSTYGQRYGNQMLKSPFANVWQMVFSPSFGVEAHLKRYDKEALNTLKPELMKIKSKLGM